MTEEQIRQVVERETIKLNARRRHGRMTQDQYDARAEQIRAWAENKYAESFYAGDLNPRCYC